MFISKYLTLTTNCNFRDFFSLFNITARDTLTMSTCYLTPDTIFLVVAHLPITRLFSLELVEQESNPASVALM